MASRNLEQGIVAVQQGQLQEGQRLLKIALKNDMLTIEERVRALTWLAETESDMQAKLQHYREAQKVDPTNQDVNSRVAWAQQALGQQQSQNQSPNNDFWLGGNTSAQNPALPSQNNPNWQGNQPPANQSMRDSQTIQPLNPNWQQQPGYNTPSQGMNPVNPNNPNWQGNQPPANQSMRDSQIMQNPNWQQQPGYNTPSQGMNPVNPNNPNWQSGNVPSEPIHPTNPNQNWQQQGPSFNTPSQGMPPTNPNQNWQQQAPSYNTPSQGMPPANPNQNWQQQQAPSYNTPSQGMPATNPNQNWQQQQQTYGQTQPIQIQQVQRSVGILEGPNGRGTGFFVTREGLIATTRHVVGGERRITIQLMDGQLLQGEVVRSFPEFDLTFIQTNVQLVHLMSTTQIPNLPHNMDIVAVPHVADGIKSTIRATRHAVAPHWFPTVINDMPDAGGHPVFDGQRLLIGMLTKNATRSNGYMFGLHIHKIYQCVNQYLQEKQQFANKHISYCDACGNISQAPSFGGFFCEHCGNTLPYAKNSNRYPQPNMSSLYGESSQAACPNCQSQVGFYNRSCLRCGYDL